MRQPALLLLFAAACGDDPDPCASLDACIRLHVHSATVERVDTLELDLLYGSTHATTATQASGGVDLSLVTAIEIQTTQPIRVGIVAAGKLGSNVLGTGAATAMLDPGAHVDVQLALSTVTPCVAGAYYCGGDKLAGDPMTLYQCNAGGVPLARGICEGGCLVRPADEDACAGVGGPCVEGGYYCGGDKVDGDPQTLYRCSAGAGTQGMVCVDGCVVGAAGADDHCR